jgi:hypothetical protein
MSARIVARTEAAFTDECRVYKLRHVGPAILRPSINPISPFRTALDG